MSFFSDVKDRLEKIPPWGYAAIAGGVLLLAYLSQKGSGGSERVIYSVSPGEADPNGDSQREILFGKIADLESKIAEGNASLQDRLDGQIDLIKDKVYEGDDKLFGELDNLRGAIDSLKNAPVYSPSPSPAPAPAPAPTPVPQKDSSWTIGKGIPKPTPGTKPQASDGLAAYQRGDMAGLQKEIERAKSVIEWRKGEGMDTSQQEKYLNSLINLP